MNTYTRFLQKEEAHLIFKQHLKHHFPANEVKPWKSISRMWDQDCYFAVGVFETGDGSADTCNASPTVSTPDFPDALRGYAFFVEAPNCDACLLDYYAILPEYRSSGLGGKSLKALSELVREKGKYILLETEDIDFAKNDAQVEERTRRDSFYTRNGCWKTDTKGSVFGVKYAIWALGLDPMRETTAASNVTNDAVSDATSAKSSKTAPALSEDALNKACADMNTLYQLMIPGQKFLQFVKIQRV